MMEQARALWDPDWYALDQPIAVGEEREYFFFAETPDAVRERGFEFQFSRGDIKQPFEVRHTTILSIEHAELGAIKTVRIGLSYVFEPAEGNWFSIDAEGESCPPSSPFPPGWVSQYVAVPGGDPRWERWLDAPTNWELSVEVEIGPHLPDHPWASRGTPA